jgi:hypothetical protein
MLIVADVVLLTYPLELQMKQPLKTLEFYSIHTAANGPAMTYSNLAINVAEIAVQGCATWSYLLAGFSPYVLLFPYQFNVASTTLLPVLRTSKRHKSAACFYLSDGPWGIPANIYSWFNRLPV